MKPGVERVQQDFIVDCNDYHVFCSAEINERGLKEPNSEDVCWFRTQRQADAYSFLLSVAEQAEDGSLQVRAPASQLEANGFYAGLVDRFVEYGLLKLIGEAEQLRPGVHLFSQPKLYKIKKCEPRLIPKKSKRVTLESEPAQAPAIVPVALLSKDELKQQIESEKEAICKAKQEFAFQMEIRERNLASLQQLLENYDLFVKALTGKNLSE